jgi:hypothetical protein
MSEKIGHQDATRKSKENRDSASGSGREAGNSEKIDKLACRSVEAEEEGEQGSGEKESGLPGAGFLVKSVN